MPKPVISDASVAMNLAIIGQLDLLKVFFGEVLIPEAVWKEVVLEGRGKPGASEVAQAVGEGWLKVIEVEDKALVRFLKRELDRGEAECIAYAVRYAVDWVLLDEGDAREIADVYNLRKTGVIGILLRAKAEDKVSSLKEVMDALRDDAHFWIGDRLYELVLKQAGEL